MSTGGQKPNPATRTSHGVKPLSFVLAAAALHAVRGYEVGRDQPGVEAEAQQLACPVVGPGAGFHRHHAARRQLCAPRHKALARQGLGGNDAPCRIHRVNLDHALGQIDPDSCNLTHETSPFRFQIDFENSILALAAGAGLREVPSYSSERTAPA